jgi:hypothetical protein
VPQALDYGEQRSYGGDVEIVKRISFSWSFGRVVAFVETPRRFNTVFFFRP